MCASTKSWSTSKVTTWSKRSLQEGRKWFLDFLFLIWNFPKLEGFSRPSLSHSARLSKTKTIKVTQVEVTGFIQVMRICEHIYMQLPELKQDWVFYRTKRWVQDYSLVSLAVFFICNCCTTCSQNCFSLSQLSQDCWCNLILAALRTALLKAISVSLWVVC